MLVLIIASKRVVAVPKNLEYLMYCCVIENIGIIFAVGLFLSAALSTRDYAEEWSKPDKNCCQPDQENGLSFDNDCTLCTTFRDLGDSNERQSVSQCSIELHSLHCN